MRIVKLNEQLCSWSTLRQNELPGMRAAIEVLEKPIPMNQPLHDVVLHDIFSMRSERIAHKMQVIRQRLGWAWESVFSDYGYVQFKSGADLINRNKKIVLELKNGYRVNSIVKKNNEKVLREYVQQHPDYHAIMGFVNYSNDIGKNRTNRGIQFLYGNIFLDFAFNQTTKDMIIRKFRNAIRRHV